MKCQICLTNDSKYKCPTCLIHYCTLVCYKSDKHVHEEKSTQIERPQTEKPQIETVSGLQIENVKQDEGSNTNTNTNTKEQLFERIIEDDIIKQYLSQDSLRFHLSVLMKILNNDGGIVEAKAVNDTKLVVDLKLLNLRLGGLEENVLVEEFAQRVLELVNQG